MRAVFPPFEPLELAVFPPADLSRRGGWNHCCFRVREHAEFTLPPS